MMQYNWINIYINL